MIRPSRAIHSFCFNYLADPISVPGLALAIPLIVSNLINYCSDVKNERSDIQDHATDLISSRAFQCRYVESVRTIQ
jgi:hypothetical protein